jgi:hypothetical protein
MIDVNETLKEIVRMSRQVELSALNAMLIARRAGTSAVGFGIASGELRQFSQRLEGAVHALSGKLFDLVSDMAQIGIRRRRRDKLAAAARLADCDNCLQASIGGNDHWMAVQAETIRQAQSGLNLLLGQAAKLCSSGLTVARAARIEAVHGNHHAAGLRQVADEVDNVIAEVGRTLRSLQTGVAGREAA